MTAATVLLHEQGEGLGRLEASLKSVGFELTFRYREVRREDWDVPFLIAMGGGMGAFEGERFPFLSEEIRLLEDRLSSRRPSLGICLGAQLLAAAGGARNYRGAAGWELGVLPVRITEGGRGDPILGSFAPSFEVLHWHRDTFDAVSGAVHLASSDRYPQQAFALEGSYGLQFHPEADVALVRAWMAEAPPDEQFPKGWEERLEAAQPKLDRLLLRLAEHFARACH